MTTRDGRSGAPVSRWARRPKGGAGSVGGTARHKPLAERTLRRTVQVERETDGVDMSTGAAVGTVGSGGLVGTMVTLWATGHPYPACVLGVVSAAGVVFVAAMSCLQAFASRTPSQRGQGRPSGASTAVAGTTHEAYELKIWRWSVVTLRATRRQGADP